MVFPAIVPDSTYVLGVGSFRSFSVKYSRYPGCPPTVTLVPTFITLKSDDFLIGLLELDPVLIVHRVF